MRGPPEIVWPPFGEVALARAARSVQGEASCRGELSQSFRVAHRRLAEVPLVLPAEVRGVVITDSIAGLRSVETFPEHLKFSREVLDPQWLVEVLPQLLHCANYAMGVTAECREVTHAAALQLDRLVARHRPRDPSGELLLVGLYATGLAFARRVRHVPHGKRLGGQPPRLGGLYKHLRRSSYRLVPSPA
jgi:hypothetical protein